eukprot:gene8654-11697_t
MSISSKVSKSKDLSVKIAKTSMSREVLGQGKPTFEQINEAIMESENLMEPVSGKLATEAAFTIMRRLYQATGDTLVPQGHTVFKKLKSIKTDPAVKLLVSKSWREFFEETEPPISTFKKKNSNKAVNEINMNNEDINTGNEYKKKQHEMLQKLSEVFYSMVVRVEYMWDLLKMSQEDRQFYRSSLCKGPPNSLEHCQKLAAYISILKEYRKSTYSVLESIQQREKAITICYDLLSTLQRKFDGVTISAKINEQTSYSDLFWKEEILISFTSLRFHTVQVIRKIQAWRRCLWRPHPFVWRNINYLSKMRFDMNVLESPAISRILEMIPLGLNDLLCVAFFHPNQLHKTSRFELFSNKNSIQKKDRKNNLSHQEKLQQVEDKVQAIFQQGSEINHSQFILANSKSAPLLSHPIDYSSNNLYNDNDVRRIPFSTFDPATKHFHAKLEEFLNGFDPNELCAAALVVIEDEPLQSALKTERIALKEKGVFIPTVKSKPSISSQVYNNNSFASTFSTMDSYDNYNMQGYNGTSPTQMKSNITLKELNSSNFDNTNSTNRPELNRTVSFEDKSMEKTKISNLSNSNVLSFKNLNFDEITLDKNTISAENGSVNIEYLTKNEPVEEIQIPVEINESVTKKFDSTEVNANESELNQDVAAPKNEQFQDLSHHFNNENQLNEKSSPHFENIELDPQSPSTQLYSDDFY